MVEEEWKFGERGEKDWGDREMDGVIMYVKKLIGEEESGSGMGGGKGVDDVVVKMGEGW